MTANHARLTWGQVPPRTESAVREALHRHRPDLVHTFDAELKQAATDEQQQHAIRQWWALAVGVMHPDPEADEAQARFMAGDEYDLMTNPQ